MRLTQAHRDAFVNAILNDTPQTDHQTEAMKLMQAHLFDIAPPEILRAFKSEKLKPYFSTGTASFGNSPWSSFQCYLVPNAERWNAWQPKDPAIIEKLNALATAYRKQRDEYHKLKVTLHATIKGFTTVKAAVDAMPELAKYLPDPEGKAIDRTVPALANLMGDLMKAGWPKDQKKGKTK